jgi:hypothetical protein
MCQKKVWAMLKKRENIHAKEHEKNNPMLKSMKKKEKREERKVAHTFKGNCQSESCSKEYKNI